MQYALSGFFLLVSFLKWETGLRGTTEGQRQDAAYTDGGVYAEIQWHESLSATQKDGRYMAWEDHQAANRDANGLGDYVRRESLEAIVWDPSSDHHDMQIEEQS